MAAKFQGFDFYDLDPLLSDEERMIREAIREWVDDRVLPVIGEAYIERRFPTELIPEMGELGVLGANLPEEYGCAELNNVAYGIIMQELERGDSGLRSFASVQGALVMYPIYAFGSEDQKRDWLPAWPPARPSGASASPSRTTGRTPAG
jgi:glutaryl-CoA dehydrogenase